MVGASSWADQLVSRPGPERAGVFSVELQSKTQAAGSVVRVEPCKRDSDVVGRRLTGCTTTFTELLSNYLTDSTTAFSEEASRKQNTAPTLAG